MTPNEYQRLAQRTEVSKAEVYADRLKIKTDFSNVDVVEQRLRLLHGVIGLQGEVGELAYAVEKEIYYGQERDTVNLREEIGDCLWYLVMLCNAMDLSLEYCMEANIEKLKRRFPDKFDPSQAKEENRDRDAEREAIAKDDGVNYEVVKDYANSSELRTADEWCEFFETIVMDPDGWRNRGMSFSDRITYREFAQLWLESTCRYPPGKKLLKVIRSLNNNYNPESNPVETRPCCPECKTPYSDRAPVFCPECGVAQQPITKG